MLSSTHDKDFKSFLRDIWLRREFDFFDVRTKGRKTLQVPVRMPKKHCWLTGLDCLTNLIHADTDTWTFMIHVRIVDLTSRALSLVCSAHDPPEGRPPQGACVTESVCVRKRERWECGRKQDNKTNT